MTGLGGWKETRNGYNGGLAQKEGPSQEGYMEMLVMYKQDNGNNRSLSVRRLRRGQNSDNVHVKSVIDSRIIILYQIASDNRCRKKSEK